LVGRNSGRVYRLGAEVLVRLVQADGIGGRLVFRIEEAEASGAAGRPVASERRSRQHSTGKYKARRR
jgi:hypothetical protein